MRPEAAGLGRAQAQVQTNRPRAAESSMAMDVRLTLLSTAS